MTNALTRDAIAAADASWIARPSTAATRSARAADQNVACSTTSAREPPMSFVSLGFRKLAVSS